jgi:hypothetical protein
LPEQNYAMAHKMGDLKLGDVHLIPISSQIPPNTEIESKTQIQNEGDNNTNATNNENNKVSSAQESLTSTKRSPQLYVANVICQTRRSGSISPINMLKLQEALKKIAVVAKKLKGFFHL